MSKYEPSLKDWDKNQDYEEESLTEETDMRNIFWYTVTEGIMEEKNSTCKKRWCACMYGTQKV